MISVITLHAKPCPASDLIHAHASCTKLIRSSGLLMLYELKLCFSIVNLACPKVIACFNAHAMCM